MAYNFDTLYTEVTLLRVLLDLPILYQTVCPPWDSHIVLQGHWVHRHKNAFQWEIFSCPVSWMELLRNLVYIQVQYDLYDTHDL